ncbi:hypothetical protein VCHENC02_4271B, partial [Vibrio harveyi]
ILAVQHPR